MFSKATEYAMRAAIYLAQKSTADQKIGIAELADAIDAPRSFTAKILQLLSRDQDFVQSTTGPNGGFYMSEDAKSLTLMHVITLLGEEETVTACILGLQACSETNPCPMHERYKKIRAQLLLMLEAKSIRQLSREMNKPNVVIHNPPARKKAKRPLRS